MTAFAINLQRNSAIVASDSLAYIPDRKQVVPLGFITKTIPLPQHRAVLLSRGQQDITVRATMMVQMRPELWSIEDLARALPPVLQDVTADYCYEHDIDDPLGVGLLEAVLLGWSAEKRRMRLWQFLNYRDYVAEDAGEMYGVHAFPRLPPRYMPRVTGAATDKTLVEIIQAAGRYFEDDPVTNCGMRVGGEVVSTEISEHGMTHRVLHRFADYDRVRTASSAIVARIERGDMDVDGIVAEGLVPIGDVVDSETGQPLSEAASTAPRVPEVLQGMTRQQRRAAEREAAKGRRAA